MTFEEFDDACMRYFPDGFIICNEKYPKFWRLPPGETHELRFESHTRFMGKLTTMICRVLKAGDQIICMCGAAVIEKFDTMEQLEDVLKWYRGIATVKVCDSAMVREMNS